ncbi:hypothetical protein GWI33_016684 [Rhynchophorus ferrugineus]|uniref:Uncharacterized protein n=1 Tax=Rhynchophorus ferrugineus TaxID=354439 RepID=A0A834M4S3_RHYFE|nr:hypothetical protein GWI33_016684 [Rhynchophorus ferrugineus]
MTEPRPDRFHHIKKKQFVNNTIHDSILRVSTMTNRIISQNLTHNGSVVPENSGEDAPKNAADNSPRRITPGLSLKIWTEAKNEQTKGRGRLYSQSSAAFRWNFIFSPKRRERDGDGEKEPAASGHTGLAYSSFPLRAACCYSSAAVSPFLVETGVFFSRYRVGKRIKSNLLQQENGNVRACIVGSQISVSPNSRRSEYRDENPNTLTHTSPRAPVQIDKADVKTGHAKRATGYRDPYNMDAGCVERGQRGRFERTKTTYLFTSLQPSTARTLLQDLALVLGILATFPWRPVLLFVNMSPRHYSLSIKLILSRKSTNTVEYTEAASSQQQWKIHYALRVSTERKGSTTPSVREDPVDASLKR